MLSLLTSRVFLSDKKTLGDWWEGQKVKDSFWRIYFHSVPGVSIEVDGKLLEAEANRYLVIPGWTPFITHGPEPISQYQISFDIPALSLGDVQRLFPFPVVLPVIEPYCSLGVLWRNSVDNRHLARIAANALTHSFVEAVCAFLVSGLDAASIQILSERLQPDSRVTRVINEIEKNIGSELTLASLAEKANLSRDHLIRLFRRKLGLTPKQFILDLRIKKAAELLNSTRMSMEQIAEDLGFSDRYHLTRAFHQSIGINPGEYRRSFQPSSSNTNE